MQYRREIDGLRAVAVLPVILFHAGLSVFSGGFVGVDVFFVISGYLITSILIADREAGRYSLLQFYERRARRILPALFVILAFSFVVAWFWMPPYLFEGFARSLKYTAFFASNVHFWEFTGYFEPDSEMQPLLHTWSLAVEEQYYILFPLLLMALGKFRAAVYATCFLIIAALSLGLSEWGWRNYPEENFFFTFSRFWELLAGSLCAVWLRGRELRGNETLAGLGLLMILVGIFYFDDFVPFPSLFTLLPVVGTVLIILFASPDTSTARVLSWAPLVGIGLISYSAYLWHQPLFAFARIMTIEEPSLALMGGLAVVSLGLAGITWRFVEQPFRRKPIPLLPKRSALFAASIAGLAAFFAIGQSGYLSEGFKGRLASSETPYFVQLLKPFDDDLEFPNGCFDGSAEDRRLHELCEVYSSENPTQSVGLIGDSHAVHLLLGLQPVADAINARIIAASTPACPPLLGVQTANPFVDPAECKATVEGQVASLIERQVDSVVLVARWSLYTTDDYYSEHPNFALKVDGQPLLRDPVSALAAFETGLEQTVAVFTEAGINVVLVRQVPAQKVFPRQMVERAMLLGIEEEEARAFFAFNSVSVEEHVALQSRANAVLDRQASDTVKVIDLEAAFRTEDRYAWVDGAQVLFLDRDHLSVEGAHRAGRLMARILTP